MTARRYQRPSQRRDLSDARTRIEALEFANPLPTFRARRQYGSLAITTAGASTGGHNICWDTPEICSPDFFSEGLMGSGVCSGQLIGVNLLVTGVYAIHAQLDFEETLNFESAIGVFDVINSKMWHSLHDWLDVGTADPTLTIEVVRAYNELDGAQITIEVQQNSGSDKNIGSDDTNTSNFFQIYYLGGYACDDCASESILPYFGGGGGCVAPGT